MIRSLRFALIKTLVAVLRPLVDGTGDRDAFVIWAALHDRVLELSAGRP